MPHIYTKEDAIQLKKECFKHLTSMLESFIAKPSPSNKHETDYIKKASLISKWLKQYVNYISFETKFTPHRLISYNRGDIVFVNFGFNIGAEFGGEHYAVVIDKENDRNSPTVTVIPLSSYKPNKPVHSNDLYLGNELFEKLQLKLKTLTPQLREQYTKNKLMLDIIKERLGSDNTETELDELEKLVSELEQRQKQLHQEIDNTERIKNELLTLKQGSIAKIRQITTISKMRIYNPKNSSDPLYGIRFSEETMKIINAKLKDCFIFSE